MHIFKILLFKFQDFLRKKLNLKENKKKHLYFILKEVEIVKHIYENFTN